MGIFLLFGAVVTSSCGDDLRVAGTECSERSLTNSSGWKVVRF